jgi:putative transposase
MNVTSSPDRLMALDTTPRIQHISLMRLITSFCCAGWPDPSFPHRPSTILVFRKVRSDVEEPSHGGADYRCAEAGRTTEDVAREQGVSKHTIYAWKAKYGGMEVSEAEEVKHLRDENSRLKKLVADLSLDKDMLQSVIRKNSLGS